MLSRSRVPATSRHAPPVRCRGDRRPRPRPDRHLQPDRPSLRARPSGAVAGPALARPRGDRAGDARDGAPPARPARAGRPRPGPDAPRPRAGLLPGRLGAADLRRAAVLRLGRLAGGPPDGGAPPLAGAHAPRAGPRGLAGGRVGARAGDRGDAARAARARRDQQPRLHRRGAHPGRRLPRSQGQLARPALPLADRRRDGDAARAVRAGLRPDRGRRPGGPDPREQRRGGRGLPPDQDGRVGRAHAGRTGSTRP